MRFKIPGKPPVKQVQHNGRWISNERYLKEIKEEKLKESIRRRPRRE